MHPNELGLLRQAAIPTGAVGLVAAIIAWLVAGVPGMVGAVVGTLLVASFFTISLVAVTYASKISPGAMMGAALGTYLVKIVALGVAMSLLADVGAWNMLAMAWTVIACTVVWIGFEARGFWKLRLTVEPGAKAPWER